MKAYFGIFVYISEMPNSKAFTFSGDRSFSMKKYIFIIFVVLFSSCKEKTTETAVNYPVLEVAGKFLYKDEIDKIIPPNSSVIDSADVVDRYIRKWVTEVLMYDNARRNISSLEEINKLVEEYRKSLIIHEYEQALVNQRVNEKISEKELLAFYDKYKSQMVLEDNLIKGLLLILPKDAPQLNEVYSWVRSADNASLEKIEKYSLQNAISFDYFDEWTPFAEIIRKTPFVVENSKDFVTGTRFAEVSDSTKQYFLRISEAIPIGGYEPYELAKDRISNTILNKKKTDFIVEFEKSIYQDALNQGEINFFKKK